MRPGARAAVGAAGSAAQRFAHPGRKEHSEMKRKKWANAARVAMPCSHSCADATWSSSAAVMPSSAAPRKGHPRNSPKNEWSSSYVVTGRSPSSKFSSMSTSFSPSMSSIGGTPSRDASRRASAVNEPVVMMMPLPPASQNADRATTQVVRHRRLDKPLAPPRINDRQRHAIDASGNPTASTIARGHSRAPKLAVRRA